MKKRFVALVLTLALVVNLCTCAAASADSFVLPKNLQEISEEAFSGVSLLDTVVVPYGTLEIRQRAFADTQLSEIYIPETVVRIAEDAFEGTVFPRIIAPSGSYAQQYAEAHNLAWKDSEGFYAQEGLESGIAVLDGIYDIQPLNTAEFDFTPVSADGVTDPETLAKIEAFNQLLLELEANQQSYDAALGELTENWRILAEEATSYSFSLDGENITMQGNGASVTLSPDTYEMMNREWELESVAASADAVMYGINAGGEECYVTVQSAGISITTDPVLSGSVPVEEMDSEIFAAMTPDIEFLEKTMQTVTGILEKISKPVGLFSSALDEAIKIADESIKKAEKLRKTSPGTKTLQLAEKNAAAAAVNKTALMKFVKLLAPINTALAGKTIGEDSAKFMQLMKIWEHGHPTVEEQLNSGKKRMAEELMINVATLQLAYLTEIIWTLVETVSMIITVASAAASAVPGVGWATAVAGLATVAVTKRVLLSLVRDISEQFLLGGLVGHAEACVKQAEALLHGHCFGQVTDALTGDPISEVKVQCGEEVTYTDRAGSYLIKLSSSMEEATFTSAAYQTKTYWIYQSTSRNNVQMSPLSCISGTVTFADNGEPAAGITIELDENHITTTASDGQYMLYAPVGNVTLTANKGTINEKQVNIKVEQHFMNHCDFTVTHKKILRGTVTCGSNPLDGVMVVTGNQMALTADDGTYTIITEKETDTVSFLKTGYETRIFDFTFDGKTEIVQDATLTAEPNEPGGTGNTTPSGGSTEGDYMIPGLVDAYYRTNAGYGGERPCSTAGELMEYLLAQYKLAEEWKVDPPNITSVSLTYYGTQAFIPTDYYGLTVTSVTLFSPDTTVQLAEGWDEMPEMNCLGTAYISHLVIPSTLRALDLSGMMDLQTIYQSAPANVECSPLTIANGANSPISSVVLNAPSVTVWNECFKECKNLATFEIPSCTSFTVEEYGFYDCDSLQQVYAPKCQDMTIGEYAFARCTNLKYTDISHVNFVSKGAFVGCTSLQTVVTPSSGEIYIMEDVFSYCRSLQRIDLSHCYWIDKSAFQGCENLTTVYLPKSGNYITINENAFAHCSKLRSINLEKCYNISPYAFFGCISLTTVNLSGCALIQGSAFSDSGLSNVMLPKNSPFSIDERAFQGCVDLVSINLDNCTSIGTYAFYDCTSLSNVNLANCERIGERAFSDCVRLAGIQNPAKVTDIGESAFYGCTSLAEVDLSSCTSIGQYAFTDCSNLRTINLSSCRYIRESAFSNCSNLEEVVLGECWYIESGAFRGCTSLSRIDLSQSNFIRGSAFFGCTSLKTADLSRCVSLGNVAFSDCTNLTEVNFSTAMLSELPIAAFQDCTSLKTVIMNDKIQSIGNGAFLGCSSLQQIQLPESLTTIGNGVFTDCSGLKEITLPANLTTIGMMPFDSSLREITCFSNNAFDPTAFERCTDVAVLNAYEGSPIAALFAQYHPNTVIKYLPSPSTEIQNAA